MKIAIITLEYPPNIFGGAGVYITRIVKELVSRDHEIHVFTLGNHPSYSCSSEGRRYVHRLPIINYSSFRTLTFWATLPWIFKSISRKAGEFDLVHSNGISDLTLSKHMSPQPRIVTVHHLAGTHLRAVRPSLKQRIFHPGSEIGLIPYLEPISIRRADRIVAVSGYTRSELIAKYNLNPEAITVIHHGANPEEYRFPAEELARLRVELGIGCEQMILCVSRLEVRKGIDILLKAFAYVQDKCKAVLVLAGGGPQEFYRALALRLGIGKRVIFLGHVNELALRKLYAACDLFVLPSLMEGLGIVALEARAAGKFLVASCVGGIPEIVPPKSGFLTPPGKELPLAHAMLKALCKQQNELPPVRTWAEATEELSAFYHTVMAEAVDGRSRLFK